jgi:hypothetical protein
MKELFFNFDLDRCHQALTASRPAKSSPFSDIFLEKRSRFSQIPSEKLKVTQSFRKFLRIPSENLKMTQSFLKLRQNTSFLA